MTFLTFAPRVEQLAFFPVASKRKSSFSGERMLDLVIDSRQDVQTTLVELLDIIDSCRSTSTARYRALSRLEELFGDIVLDGNKSTGASLAGSRGSRGRQAVRQAWWNAQAAPRSCISLSLKSLIHRLHLQCLAPSAGIGSFRGKEREDESSLLCSQYISSFTILQGLCLKDVESQHICARKSTIELLLDIIQAEYWRTEMLTSNAPAYAIDLLICITVSSPSASALVEELQGEEIVRRLLERHTVGESSTTDNVKRRAVTLDQVQEHPIAVKCAEFLLFFEYGREEQDKKEREKVSAVGNESSILVSDAFRNAVSRSSRQDKVRTGEAKKTRSSAHNHRSRSSSPLKQDKSAIEASKARREERIRLMRSRPIRTGESGTADEDGRSQRTPVNLSPVRSAPVTLERQGRAKTSLTPFTSKSASASPRKKRQEQCMSLAGHTLRRGRSSDRSPLGITQPSAFLSSGELTESPSLLVPSSLQSSPLKALIGPSPAVKRAQARSVSPVKRQQVPARASS